MLRRFIVGSGIVRNSRMYCSRKENKMKDFNEDDGSGTVKVAKVLGMMGVCSRRNAERLIKSGKVLVDNKPVKNVAQRIFPFGHKIRVENKDVNSFILKYQLFLKYIY